MSVESVNQLYQEIMQELALLQQFIAASNQESLGNMAVEVGQQNGYTPSMKLNKPSLHKALLVRRGSYRISS